MLNQVEGGVTPIVSPILAQEYGFDLVFYPTALTRAFGFMAQQFLTTLKAEGTSNSMRDQMFDIQQLNEMLETQSFMASITPKRQDILAQGKAVEGL
ncbi:hypothetical protein [Dongshaea marina]|uniref:hypothetical protein n=1 Tax=Dongshaea marina TaxID=2047966 RepID=UPI0018FF2B48|nr:hypothetical protein [Dongshaea marina]